jgi:hypothetical protein
LRTCWPKTGRPSCLVVGVRLSYLLNGVKKGKVQLRSVSSDAALSTPKAASGGSLAEPACLEGSVTVAMQGLSSRLSQRAANDQAGLAIGGSTIRPRRRSGGRKFAEALTFIVMGAAAISGCGAGPTASTRPRGTVSASLATSINTSAGSWATVPMGHLGQPLNTFWQLFFRSSQAKAWSNESSALAVATNGGLVLATNQRTLTVGIRPTEYLGYSPLISTFDARVWAAANPIAGLRDLPDSLAVNARGGALALVGKGDSTRVLTSRGGLAGWGELVSQGSLASTQSGKTCGIGALTAVGYLHSQAIVGATCRRAGIIGVFAREAGAWALIGIRLPAPLQGASAGVLGMQASSRGLCALLGITARQRVGLVAACTTGTGDWRVSDELALNGADETVSLGPSSGPGLFALVAASRQSLGLEVLSASDMRWSRLASPPPGTATVSFSTGGQVEALVVDDTLFSDWQLGRAGERWRRIQALKVPIQFGSSS